MSITETVPSVTVYTGTIPDKATQTKTEFANNVQPYLNYISTTFVPENGAMIASINSWTTEANALKDEVNTLEETTITKAAEASASADNAATSESNAATSESNAKTSETNAATSESNAATSESNAATSESNAATSESNAATSETNAATQADIATTQADIATTQADIATTQAGIATTQAGIATTQAGIASTAANTATTVANNKGAWSGLTGALDVPSTVNHNGCVWLLNVDLVDVTQSEPTDSNTDWTKITYKLDKVDNTSDMDKPISTAMQSALDAKEPLDPTILKEADIGTKVLSPYGDASQLTNIKPTTAFLMAYSI